MVKKLLVSRSEFSRMAGVSASAVTRGCAGPLSQACVGKRIDANHPCAVDYIEKKDQAETAATGIDILYEKAVAHCRETGLYSVRSICGIGVGKPRAKKLLAFIEAAGLIPKDGEPPPVIKTKTVPENTKARVIKGHVKRNSAKKSAALHKSYIENVVHEIPEDIVDFADMTLRELIERFGSDYAFVDWLKATKAIEDINEKRLKNAETQGRLVSRELVQRGIIEPINAVFINLLSDCARTLATRVPVLEKSGETTTDIEIFISGYIGKFIDRAKADIKKVIKDV